MFSDFHSHMDGYEPAKLREVLDKATAEQVEIILANGTTLESSGETVRVAQQHPVVRAAIGIHPWNAIAPTAEVMKRLGELAREKGVVAIGEVGLDYVRKPETRETQLELFRQQVSLAADMGLPLDIHCKGAEDDILQILRQHGVGKLRGALHGFSGDAEALTGWLKLGFCVSIGTRAFTREETPGFREAVKHIPRDRLLLETDSSARSVASGEMLGPASVVFVAEKLATILSATAEDIGSSATTNLKRLLAGGKQGLSQP
ncbi:MAG: TatD family hydrolase [Chloroflexi bacterium]|nr:TatD family hydrolase [Chloroflexota bacterium]